MNFLSKLNRFRPNRRLFLTRFKSVPIALMSLLCIAVGTSCVSLSGDVQNDIALPNPNTLGSPADIKNEILVGKSSLGGILPVEVRLVIDKGTIDEVQAFYSKEVEIDQIAAAINAKYHGWEITSLRGSDFRMWGNPAANFQIQLSKYSGEKIVLGNEGEDYGPVLHNGEKLLIYTTTHKSHKKMNSTRLP